MLRIVLTAIRVNPGLTECTPQSFFGCILQSAQLGLLPYLAFLALISISLGVLNLLPIPLLDGGHLMYYTIEVLKGSPVSERVMEHGQRAGLVVLLFLMAFAFYNDINRLITG